MTMDERHDSWCSGPVDFGDAAAEETAARQQAALFEPAERTHLSLTGRDRARFLHGFCTNDIKKLKPGEGCEAFVTNIKGRILEQIFVWVNEESIEIEATPGREDALFSHLDRYLITDDVAIHRRSGELAEFFVTGPHCDSVLQASGLLSDALEPDRHRSAPFAEEAVSVRRSDLFGRHEGFVVCPRKVATAVRERLVAGGARPAGRTVFELLRIEAGVALFGVDLTDDNLAQEASRTARCISFTKGCYLGQEPIARLDALGHVNRRLALVRMSGDAIPSEAAPLFCGDQEAGTLTSAARSPLTGEIVALGMVRAKFANPGTAVECRVDSGTLRGSIEAFRTP